MQARYTDGTPVQEGDRVRYHQSLGGLMSPPSNPDGSIKWYTGTATTFPPYQEDRDAMLARRARDGGGTDPDELYCKYDEGQGWMGAGEYGHMAPHVIERLESEAVIEYQEWECLDCGADNEHDPNDPKPCRDCGDE